MKILLFYIGTNIDAEHNIEENNLKDKPPFGLLSIYSFLREKNYDAECINLSSWDKGKIGILVKDRKPDVVGITCYSFNRFAVMQLAELIKCVDEQIKVVLGGPHASHMFKQILENYKQIDFVVLGEGEITFRLLIDALIENKGITLIKGVAFRGEGGKAMSTGKSDYIKDLDILPFPASYQKVSYPMVFTSRGCPGKCVYCCTPKLWGRKVRFRSVGNVVDEMEVIHRQGNPRIYVLDDTFTVNRKRVMEICKEIIRRRLSFYWTCNSRVNYIDEEMVVWMKKAGCIKMNFGVESGSPVVLDNIAKQANVKQVLETSATIRKYGIQLRFFLIVGSPGENDETINKTIELIRECEPCEILVYEMSYSPGTSLYESGIINEEINEKMWMIDTREEIPYIRNDVDPGRIKDYKNRLEMFFISHKNDFKFSLNDRKRVASMLPDCAHVHHELAISYLDEGQIREALRELDAALKLNGNQFEILKDYAVAFNRLGKLDQANRYLSKAQSVFSDSVD